MRTRRRLWFLALVLAIVLVAVGGWAVEGARWALTGSRGRALPAPA
jgi:hypothetical protein